MVNHHIPIICLRCEILDDDTVWPIDCGMPIAASMRAKYEDYNILLSSEKILSCLTYYHVWLSCWLSCMNVNV